MRAESGEAPLVFEFVKDVFGIGALPVEFDDLEAFGFFEAQVGDVGVDDFFGEGPEFVLGGGVQRLEGSAHDDSAFFGPALELEFDLGDLVESFGGASLPVGPGDSLDGAFDVFGELELE